MNPLRIGVLTPSSNTVMEPYTSALLAKQSDISAHFNRLPVLRIALDDSSAAQFSVSAMSDAARLLADAKVHSIMWGGTSGSWLGFEHDSDVAATITGETGIPGSTVALALKDLFRLKKVKRFALVTPYVESVQSAIIANFGGEGFHCVAESHLGDEGNFSFAQFDEQTIADQLRKVAAAGPQAITVLCTNFRGTAIAVELEKELGIPIYDSIAISVWQSLRLAGVKPDVIKGWGSLFSAAP